MSITVAKYTFGSWLRKGIGGRINQTDNLGDGSASNTERATVDVQLNLNDKAVPKRFELLGPGDVIGINPAMVVRTEPRNYVNNFEPNYLPFIEFYDEDFVWRYTPAKANGENLRPWLALIVLKDAATPGMAEFSFNEQSIPLPRVTVNKADHLPPVTQTWAWSHVHVNEGHASTTEFEAFLKTLSDLDNANSDKIISRLMCPRKLETNTAYRAFVVPAFETGRLAGLAKETTGVDAQQPSWKAGEENTELPVYYHWSFQTGDNQDFESLVKILEPRIMDERLGIRDLNGTDPGFGMTVGTNIGNTLPDGTPEIIGLEGALKSPSTKSNPQVLDTSRPFFTQLKDILNFPSVLQKSSNTAIDPVVAPPIYGQNHAMTNEIAINDNGWLHQLNKDPRNRVPAGFGTNVVQKNQEDYVARAWKQVEKILEANRKILFVSFSMNVVQGISKKFTGKLTPEKTLLFFSPLLKKVKGSPTTLHYQLQESLLPSAAVSTTLRRIIRPRGPFFKKIAVADPSFSHSGMLNDINEGKISAAPSRLVPEGLPTVKDLTKDFPKTNYGPGLTWILSNLLLWLILVLLAILLFGLFTGAWTFCFIAALIAVAAYSYGKKLKNIPTENDAFNQPEALVEALTDLPPKPGFVFTETNPVTTESSSGSTVITTQPQVSSSADNPLSYLSVGSYTPAAAGKDSVEAANFRAAALDLNLRQAIAIPEKKYTRFDMANAQEKLQLATDPRKAFPKMLATLVFYSFNKDWLFHFENLVPAMAYPDFPDPMYEKLRDISSELLIPNLNLIPPNTISLLVTNPEFIESYMVGLNHEFGKELLWREYPTDKRGSYFRQFWDVKGIITNETGLNEAELKEKYKDIKPIDKWFSHTPLGDHPNRKLPDGDQLVLVVRGELLKKYPNTIIYAQKAHIYKDENGVADAKKEPIIIPISMEADMSAEIKFPLFKAEINPDIKFFGFDLTALQAKGAADPKLETDDWGWYFVIQEIPGEPRFGMDIAYDPDDDKKTPITWDDLSWENYTTSNGFINTAVKPHNINLDGPADQIDQWGKNAANMGYILYQKPVMIAIHAKEMLGNIN
ncbi:hypothetical protein [Pedobacter heparinus]|uniref:hypothetical protein n=1 Tax=Pedobacter heparinus TaxID=984 RepID=UPI00292D92B3|nr:hypothetical protein [Pedobacter heparinus]